MKETKTKTTTLSIVVLMILFLSSSISLLPNVIADSPLNIPTYAFCSVAPNPVGVGQRVNINFWLTLPPPYGEALWENMTIVITSPTGTTDKLGPFKSDLTGGSHTTYTPTVEGNYTFKLIFSGQTVSNRYYEQSSSNIVSLTVQQEQINYPPQTALPTSYWSRPIYAENNNWYSIAGNWLGLGATTFGSTGLYNASTNYNPYTTAPNSAHILWTKPVAFGGIMGGEFGYNEANNFYSTSQYEPKFQPIIMNGILYYTMYPGASSNPAGWAAVDLQTGQTLWTKNTTEVLVCGQILNFVNPSQYGGIAYLWSEPASSSSYVMSSGSLEMWDAMTGNYILTINNTPPMYYSALVTDEHGNLLLYYINATDSTINMWNSTKALGPQEWRPIQNAVIDIGEGIQWTAPLATNISGNPLVDYANGLFGLTLYGVESDVILLNINPSNGLAYGFTPGWQIEAGYSAVDGRQLWLVNRTITPYALTLEGALGFNSWLGMGNGVYVEETQGPNTITGYSLETGNLVWGPVALPNADPFTSLGVSSVTANGTIYVWTFGGDVYAFNILTGALKWQYHTPSGGIESPISKQPLWVFTVGTIADGKLFLPEGHMYSPPLFHKARQLALNITDGSVVWSIEAYDTTTAPAIVDGIMTTLNAYDNQIYAYGKGPSTMTLTAPQVGVTTATPVTLTGTVMDISAGSQQKAVAANFHNGLPCVSDDSMTQFMQAVYMQQPMPNNTTGVLVTISVLDSNNNFRQIGTTTSTGSGTFAYTWTPDITGDYNVIANFAGSESYYPSSAETHFNAANPAPTAAPVATTTPSMADQYFIPSVAAIIIVIIIGFVVLALLMLRKRP